MIELAHHTIILNEKCNKRNSGESHDTITLTTYLYKGCPGVGLGGNPGG